MQLYISTYVHRYMHTYVYMYRRIKIHTYVHTHTDVQYTHVYVLMTMYCTHGPIPANTKHYSIESDKECRGRMDALITNSYKQKRNRKTCLQNHSICHRLQSKRLTPRSLFHSLLSFAINIPPCQLAIVTPHGVCSNACSE